MLDIFLQLSVHLPVVDIVRVIFNLVENKGIFRKLQTLFMLSVFLRKSANVGHQFSDYAQYNNATSETMKQWNNDFIELWDIQ